VFFTQFNNVKEFFCLEYTFHNMMDQNIVTLKSSILCLMNIMVKSTKYKFVIYIWKVTTISILYIKASQIFISHTYPQNVFYKQELTNHMWSREKSQLIRTFPF